MGDAVDYGHWKSCIRQESLIFGGGSLGFNIGSDISAAIVTAMLGAAIVLPLYRLDRMYPPLTADLQEQEKNRPHSD